MKKFSYMFILILIFIGCENLNEPFEKPPPCSVVFYLNADASDQPVYIYEFLDTTGHPGWISPDNFTVENAEISLMQGNQLLTGYKLYSEPIPYPLDPLRFDQSVYYKNTDSVNIIPGEKYNLNIKVGDVEISGSTLVPGDFDIYLPERDTMKIEDLDGIEIRWSKSAGAAFYVCSFEVASLSRWDSTKYIGFPEVINPSGTYIENLNYTLKFDPKFYSSVDSVLLYISAMDTNSYNNKYKSIKNAGLKNALGVMGSYKTETCVIIISD